MRKLLAAILLCLPLVAAAGSATYTDPRGDSLRIFDEPCDVPEAFKLLLARGVPPAVAAMALRAEATNGVEKHKACWVADPMGNAFVVAPSIGTGALRLPLDVFVADVET